VFTVLYVDDEPGLLEVGKLFLERGGQFTVDTITSAPAALALMNTKSYDAIISDYQMPVMDGIEFLKKVRGSGNTIPFILFTGRFSVAERTCC
jgi:CheY-like chemotaxis protein